MSQTPPEVLKSSTIAAELADRLTISREQDAFRLELGGRSGDGAAGMVKREELQRILQMLHGVVAQAGWLAAPGAAQPPPRCQAILSRRDIRQNSEVDIGSRQRSDQTKS
jgi:hypothetical protein